MLDTSVQLVLDEFVRLAAALCGTPTALITLQDEALVRFPAKMGWDGSDTPQETPFCSYAIAQEDVFIVPDALMDARFAAAPLVIGDASVRFYAGATLLTSCGHAIGTLCVLDHVPRELSGSCARALQALAHCVTAELELGPYAPTTGRAARPQRGTETATGPEIASALFPSNKALSEPKESESLRSRERLRLALESTGCVLWESKLSTGQVSVSEEWSRLRGGPPGETSTTFPDLLQLIHPDEREKVHRNQTEVVKGRKSLYEDEMRLATISGDYLWLGIRGKVVDRDASGRALRMTGIMQDITERKRTEAENLRTQERLRLALESSGYALWDRDLTGDHVYLSEEWSLLRGGPAEESVTTFAELLSLVHPDEREPARAKQMETIKGNNPRYVDEMRVMTEAGQYAWIVVRGRVVKRDPAGRALRMIGIIADVTDRKRVEHRLREHTERLQALSHRLLDIQETERRVLARELHDEIGQVLTAVKLNLQSIERMATSASTAHSVADGIVIVEQAIEQVRSLSLDLRPTILDDLGLIPALHWYLGRQAERLGLSVTLTAEPLAARSRRTVETACFRVVQEALTNAARHAHAQRVSVDVKQTDGWLCVSIRDDGTGFDVSAAKDRARRGESAGLLGMEERALLAGGMLELESPSGGGTTIRARFRLDGETA
ncbi:PAS domain-containing protein [Paraburkholderia sediminicola]|uniref:histidine kinase n=1 Tax=Paraburkholderia metrosideri TaxID=580937 RepID=A0ABW9E0P3_9BURK